MAGDARAVARIEAEFFGEVEWSARRLRATREQADEVRSRLGRLLFVGEPGRVAGLAAYSGRGDLGSYIRVIATRELVRVIAKGRSEVAVADPALFDQLSPALEPGLRYLRERYRGEVDLALRAALAGLSEESRALLRYSLIDGWNIDWIAELYGIHRSTAARRVSAAATSSAMRSAPSSPRASRSRPTRSTRSSGWCREPRRRVPRALARLTPVFGPSFREARSSHRCCGSPATTTACSSSRAVADQLATSYARPWLASIVVDVSRFD